MLSLFEGVFECFASEHDDYLERELLCGLILFLILFCIFCRIFVVFFLIVVLEWDVEHFLVMIHHRIIQLL